MLQGGSAEVGHQVGEATLPHRREARAAGRRAGLFTDRLVDPFRCQRIQKEVGKGSRLGIQVDALAECKGEDFMGTSGTVGLLELGQQTVRKGVGYPVLRTAEIDVIELRKPLLTDRIDVPVTEARLNH